MRTPDSEMQADSGTVSNGMDVVGDTVKTQILTDVWKEVFSAL